MSWQHHVLQNGENHEEDNQHVDRPGPGSRDNCPRRRNRAWQHGSGLPGSNDVKVTLVYQHALRGTPDISVKAK